MSRAEHIQPAAAAQEERHIEDMRRKEAGQPAEEGLFAVTRQEGIADAAEQQCDDEQQRPTLHEGQRRKHGHGQRLCRRAGQRRPHIQGEGVDHCRHQRKNQCCICVGVDAAGKRHRHALAPPVAALRRNNDFAASAAPPVINTQAARIRSDGSATPAAISTNVDSSGAA